MAFDPNGDRAARGTALRGAAVGLALAAALLLPALLSGGVPARGDLPDFFWPMKAYTAERWAAGSVPLWNPLSGAGEPWLAQLQSGALYPGDLPFLLGEERGALLGIALHLAIAAAGMAFWLWDVGASRAGALVAGGLYAGGGAFLSLVPVYNNACTAAWLPWIFAGMRRAALGRSRGVGAALATAAAFLAGEPALATAGSLAAAVLALASGAEGEAPEARPAFRRQIARVSVPLLTGILLAAAALLPFAQLVVTAERRERTSRAEALTRPVGASDLADLVASPRPETTRTQAPGRGGYLVSLALGPAALLLAAGAGAGLPGRRRFLACLALLGAGGLLLSLGQSGVLAPLLYDLGALRGVRFPARWFVFTHLALAAAAGAGLDGWIWGRLATPAERDANAAEGPQEETARRRAATVGLGIGLAFLVLLAALAATRPQVRASRDAGRSLAGFAAAATALAAVAIARRAPESGRGRGAIFVGCLAVAPLPYLAGEPLAHVPAARLVEEPEALRGSPRGPGAGRLFAPAGQDRALAGRWKHGGDPEWGERTVSRGVAALAGYSNLRHGVAVVGSGSPLGNPRTERLVGAALSGGNASQLLALVDVRRILTPYPTSLPGARLEAAAGRIRRYALPGSFGRAYFPLETREVDDDAAYRQIRNRRFDPATLAFLAPGPGPPPPPGPRPPGSWAVARFVSDDAEEAELTTSASRSSLLVLTRSWDPGWEARIDGEPAPLRRAQIGLLGVVVPAGEHRIQLAYRPLSFRVGLALSGLGLVVLLGLALAAPPGAGRR